VGEVTGIAWTDHTFNPWIGCTKVSPGCAHCYAAESLPVKFHGIQWGPGQPRHITSESNWKLPYRWAKAAAKAGVRRKVFCASLADVFEAEAPVTARRRLWELIGETYMHLDWQLVTKRPERITEVMLEDGLNLGYFEVCRCWLMTTTENQEQADKRLPHLLEVDAAVHGVSVEPMLGPVCFHLHMDKDENRRIYCKDCGAVDIPVYGIPEWVICGGESGAQARPMQAAWARSLRDQCKASEVPFFFKQWGEFGLNWLNDDNGKVPGSEWMDRMGKKAAGSLLDGVDYKQFPVVCQ
jgi:protein gp37